MSRHTKGRRSSRHRRNRGWFRKGYDPRRHPIPPNRDAARKGWKTTLERYPHLGLWLYIRVKQACTQKQGVRP